MVNTGKSTGVLAGVGLAVSHQGNVRLGVHILKPGTS
jgi:hypothetical protein